MNIYLIRHGRTGVPWGSEPDPGLSEDGIDDARNFIKLLSGINPFQLVSSNYRRCMDTAQIIAEAYNKEVTIEPRLGEVPCDAKGAEAHREWLDRVLSQNWADTTVEVQNWKSHTLAAIQEIETSTVVVTHYLTICALYSEIHDAALVDCYPLSRSEVAVIERNGEALKFAAKRT